MSNIAIHRMCDLMITETNGVVTGVLDENGATPVLYKRSRKNGNMPFNPVGIKARTLCTYYAANLVYKVANNKEE